MWSIISKNQLQSEVIMELFENKWFMAYAISCAISLLLVLIQRFVVDSKDREYDPMSWREMLVLTIIGPVTPLWWSYKKIYDSTPEPISKEWNPPNHETTMPHHHWGGIFLTRLSKNDFIKVALNHTYEVSMELFDLTPFLVIWFLSGLLTVRPSIEFWSTYHGPYRLHTKLLLSFAFFMCGPIYLPLKLLLGSLIH